MAAPTYSLTPDPTPEDAAAMIAAVQRFLADTTIPAPESEPELSGWLRASLAEGIGTRDERAIW